MTESAPSRRAILVGLAATATAALAGCGTSSTTGVANTGQTVNVQNTDSGNPQRHTYGSDPSQYGDLYLPTGTARTGTIVVIHGGFWQSAYGADLGASLGQDLAAKGWAAWNIEYRRVGNGGGWPTTLADVAAAIDHLAVLKAAGTKLDLDRVVVVGHSAGGQLAAWAAYRGSLPASAPGAHPKVTIKAVVSQAGVLDLTAAAEQSVGGTAVPDLLGGLPAKVPDRYRDASPQLQLPLNVPVRCIHAIADANVPYSQSENYVSTAKKRGADVELVTVPGDHFSLIDTSAPAWHSVLSLLPGLIG